MKSPARIILVTGAGSGLGRGLSLCLAQEGHSILATDLNLDAARETAAQIEAAGGRAQAHALDVTSESDIGRFFGGPGASGVDVLVNNAGLQHVGRTDEYSVEKWDLLISVLLKGPFLLSRAVLPGMRARGFGRIVHIGSIHSLVASPYKSAYTSAKHALLGLSKVLALETGDVERDHEQHHLPGIPAHPFGGCADRRPGQRAGHFGGGGH
jgi:3-hydroxybutyrate dehydrogenase